MEMKIIETDEQLHRLAELANEIWHEFFPSVISNEQIDYMVEKFQSYTAMKKAIEEDGYVYYGVYDGGDLCAYLGIHDEGEGTIFISKVYVRSDKRRKGVASMMLDRLHTDYPDAKKWYLTVNRHNDGAVNTYLSRGFVKAREQCADIGNGFVMDDYIMEKTF